MLRINGLESDIQIKEETENPEEMFNLEGSSNPFLQSSVESLFPDIFVNQEQVDDKGVIQSNLPSSINMSTSSGTEEPAHIDKKSKRSHSKAKKGPLYFLDSNHKETVPDGEKIEFINHRKYVNGRPVGSQITKIKHTLVFLDKAHELPVSLNKVPDDAIKEYRDDKIFVDGREVVELGQIYQTNSKKNQIYYFADNCEPVPPEKLQQSNDKRMVDGRRIITQDAFFKRKFKFISNDVFLTAEEKRLIKFNLLDGKLYVGKEEIICCNVPKQQETLYQEKIIDPNKMAMSTANIFTSLVTTPPVTTSPVMQSHSSVPSNVSANNLDNTMLNITLPGLVVTMLPSGVPSEILANVSYYLGSIQRLYQEHSQRFYQNMMPNHPFMFVPINQQPQAHPPEEMKQSHVYDDTNLNNKR